MSNFPQSFANGIALRGLPILQSQPGRVFWLSNSGVLEPGETVGSDGNKGTYYRPFATLQAAVTACTPGNGDIVMVKPNHQEFISTATALNMAVSDVAVIGLGGGSNRPLFTLDTLTTSTVSISGANVSFQNVQFVANVLNIATLFTHLSASVTGSITGNVLTVSAVGSGTLYVGNMIKGTGITANTVIMSQLSGTTGGVGTYLLNNSMTFASGTVTTQTPGFAVDNCTIRDTSAVLNFLSILATSTTDNASDEASITNSTIIQKHATGVCNLFKPTGTQDRVRVVGNNYSALTTDTGALIPISAGKILTNFLLDQNIINLVQAQSLATGILITTNGSTNSGMISRNLIKALDDTSEILVTASSGFIFSQNYYAGVADKSGYLLPAADS
jgi:hypothetical protein